MGGNIFPSTSRIPHAVYTALQAALRARLAPFFAHIATPIPAPKEDHGDVDFIAIPHASHAGEQASLLARLAGVLGATASTVNGPFLHFAVPFPADARLAQVDVQILAEHEQFEWLLFRYAHSIGGTVLGSLVRRHGLILGRAGLDVQLGPKREHRVRLSESPSDILGFYGLDAERWWSPFETQEELFRYLASSRFVHARPEGRHEGDKVLLQARFWAWVDENCEVREADEGDVKSEAVKYFGREEVVRAMEEKVAAEERDELGKERVRAWVRDRDPGKDAPNLMVRAIERWVMLRNGKLEIREEHVTDGLRLGTLLVDGELESDVQTWLEQHWQEVKAREKRRVKDEKAKRTAARTCLTE